MLKTEEIESLRIAWVVGEPKKGYSVFTCPRCGNDFVRKFVRNPLCEGCQRQVRYELVSGKTSDRQGKRNARLERATEMYCLHTEDGKTLQEVGDMYGISRERVRQLIGSLGHGIPKRVRKERVLAHPELTNDELAAVLNVSPDVVSDYRTGTRHAIKKDSAAGRGKAAEDAVSELLNNMGIGNKLMPHHHPFDILLDNGKRVDVKSRQVRLPLSSLQEHQHTPPWHFSPQLERRGHYADFFILVANNDYFVIPFEDAKDPMRFCWPAAKRPSKWHKYLNRFDLMEGN